MLHCICVSYFAMQRKFEPSCRVYLQVKRADTNETRQMMRIAVLRIEGGDEDLVV